MENYNIQDILDDKVMFKGVQHRIKYNVVNVDKFVGKDKTLYCDNEHVKTLMQQIDNDTNIFLWEYKPFTLEYYSDVLKQTFLFTPEFYMISDTKKYKRDYKTDFSDMENIVIKVIPDIENQTVALITNDQYKSLTDEERIEFDEAMLEYDINNDLYEKVNNYVVSNGMKFYIWSMNTGLMNINESYKTSKYN